MHTSPTSFSGVNTDTRTSSTCRCPPKPCPGRRSPAAARERGRQAGPESRSLTSHGEAAEAAAAWRGLAPSELPRASPRAAKVGLWGGRPGAGRRQPQRCRSPRTLAAAPRRVLPARPLARRCRLARSPGPSPAAGGGAERGGAAVSAGGVGLRLRLPASPRERLASAPPVPGARRADPFFLGPCLVALSEVLYPCQNPVRSLRLRTAAPGRFLEAAGPPAPPWPRLLRGRLVSRLPPVTWVSFS